MSESNNIRMGDPYALDHSTDFWIIRNAYYCEDYSIYFLILNFCPFLLQGYQKQLATIFVKAGLHLSSEAKNSLLLKVSTILQLGIHVL